MKVFDSRKFFKQKINGKRIELPYDVVKEIKSWDGKRVHKYANNSVKRKVFGENLYIFVGSEKISVSEEYIRDE